MTASTGGMALAIRAVATALATLEAPAMLIGELAVIAHGVARTTRDIDISVAGGVLSTEALLEVFGRAGFEPRIPDAVRFAAKSQVLLLRHTASAVELDLSLGWLTFELEAIAAAQVLSLAGVSIRVARPEDLVVYKAIAWRHRDKDDIERLVSLHGDHMDLDHVRRVVGELAEAMDDPERLSAFNLLIGG